MQCLVRDKEKGTTITQLDRAPATHTWQLGEPKSKKKHVSRRISKLYTKLNTQVKRKKLVYNVFLFGSPM